MKSAITLGLIGVGFLLLVLSAVWSSLFPATATWTPEKADQWAKIGVRIHNLAPIVNMPTRPNALHSGPDLGAAMQEYEQLKKESDVLNAEFESAHDRPIKAARILKWTGISLAVIGVIGWYAVRES